MITRDDHNLPIFRYVLPLLAALPFQFSLTFSQLWSLIFFMRHFIRSTLLNIRHIFLVCYSSVPKCLHISPVFFKFFRFSYFLYIFVVLCRCLIHFVSTFLIFSDKFSLIVASISLFSTPYPFPLNFCLSLFFSGSGTLMMVCP